MKNFAIKISIVYQECPETIEFLLENLMTGNLATTDSLETARKWADDLNKRKREKHYLSYLAEPLIIGGSEYQRLTT